MTEERSPASDDAMHRGPIFAIAGVATTMVAIITFLALANDVRGIRLVMLAVFGYNALTMTLRPFIAQGLDAQQRRRLRLPCWTMAIGAMTMLIVVAVGPDRTGPLLMAVGIALMVAGFVRMLFVVTKDRPRTQSTTPRS